MQDAMIQLPSRVSQMMLQPGAACVVLMASVALHPNTQCRSWGITRILSDVAHAPASIFKTAHRRAGGSVTRHTLSRCHTDKEACAERARHSSPMVGSRPVRS